MRMGPHVAGAPNTNNLRVRPTMILPHDVAAHALSRAPTDGRYSLIGFYNKFLAAPLASADAAIEARFTPLEEWW